MNAGTHSLSPIPRMFQHTWTALLAHAGDAHVVSSEPEHMPTCRPADCAFTAPCQCTSPSAVLEPQQAMPRYAWQASMTTITSHCEYGILSEFIPQLLTWRCGMSTFWSELQLAQRLDIAPPAPAGGCTAVPSLSGPPDKAVYCS